MKTRTLSFTLLLSIMICILTPFIGSSILYPYELLSNTPSTAQEIFFQIRLPRIILAFLAGAGLGITGMAYQTTLRNPLASPYTLGVASGASLGVSLMLFSGFDQISSVISTQAVAGTAAALCVILFLYFTGKHRLGAKSDKLLLSGIAVSLFCSSVIVLLQFLGNTYQTMATIRWLMGGLETVGYDSCILVGCFVLPVSYIIYSLHKELDILLLGEELAAARGVDVPRVLELVYLSTSVMIGIIVSVCGPIGFIGIILPHAGKSLLGHSHKQLACFTFLASGSYLVFCDTIARSCFAPLDLPVGIVTSMIGAPFFLKIISSTK